MRILPMNIGLRTLKTAIAVTVSLFLAQLFNLEYPYFVAMTAIISMDRTARLSINMGRNRVIGTLLGAFIGVIFATIDQGNPLLAGIGIMLIIVISNKLKLPGSITVGSFVCVAIMVHIPENTSPFFYGMHRTLDSLFGALIAFVINVSFMPGYSVKRLNENLLKFYPLLDKTILDFEIIKQRDFDLIYTQYNEYLEETLLYKDDVISILNHEVINGHHVKLNQYEIPLKKLELYLSVNEDELKLVLKKQLNQIL